METYLNSKLDDLTANIGDMALKRRVKRIISELDIKPADFVLDSGCGDGLYLKTIKELGSYNIIGFDLDNRSLRLAQCHTDNSVSIIQGNGCMLPFKDSAFNKIYCTEVIEHIPDDRQALKEIYRILKPKGTLILTVPNHNYPFLWDPINWVMEAVTGGHIKSGFWAGIWNMHLRLYYPKEISSLIKDAGFKVVSMEPLTHYCMPFNHIVLYGLKKVLDSGMLPDGMKNTADKFSVNENKQSMLIKLGYRVLNLLDKFNDKLTDGESSVSIFVKAVKDY